MIDLRSDTFTLPDQRMRAAMAGAEVGDDVWGEDPTVRRLEEVVARRLRKEAAMLVPSGTMANLCAVVSQTRPGDEVILDGESHIVVYEAAGGPAVGGVQYRAVECAGGAPAPEQVRAAVRSANIHHPISRLLVIENTHNRRGGAALHEEVVTAAARAAHDCGLRVHCDGARLFNAAVALQCEPAALVAACDSVSVAFSKGLGAPVGSVLAADERTIEEARRWRKRLGGGMRQAGILAAACLDALERNLERLAEDHRNAAVIAAALDGAPGATVIRVAVPTNIVMLRCSAPAADVVRLAAARGVLVTEMDRDLVRCMTYLGIDEGMATHAAAVLRGVLESVPGA